MPARSETDSRFAGFLNGKPKSATFPCAPAEGSLRLDRDEALGYLGYGDQELDCDLAARFDAIAKECEETLSPAYSWAAFAIDRNVPDGEDAGVYLSGTSARLEGMSMAAHMKGAAGVHGGNGIRARDRALPSDKPDRGALLQRLRLRACGSMREPRRSRGGRGSERGGASHQLALQPRLWRCAALDAARSAASARRTWAFGGELHRQFPARAVEEHHGGNRALRAWNVRGGREAKLRHVLARAGMHDTKAREDMPWLAI